MNSLKVRTRIRIPWFSPQRQQRQYHELAYHKNGKPWSCIKYYTKSDVSEMKDPNEGLVTTIKSIAQHEPQLQPTALDQLVHVQMIAVPWNPADALHVQGIYSNPYQIDENINLLKFDTNDSINNNVTKTNPFERIAQASRCSPYNNGTIPGSEGWGRVIDIKNVSSTSTSTSTVSSSNTSAQQQQQQPSSTLQVGDYVVPGQPSLGTYRSSFWIPSSSLIRIDRGEELYNQYGPYIPAPLFQTGSTAFRMIHDYVTPKLQPGETIIQNAGNSAVGLMVSRIVTKMLQCYCISLMRGSDRTMDQINELKKYVKEFGNATIALDEESISNPLSATTLDQLHNNTIIPQQSLARIRLALNAIGGESIQKLLHFLMFNGTIVSYGNMSKQPSISIDPSQLIFKNIHYTGFWHSHWMVQQQYKLYSTGSNINYDHNNEVITDERTIMMNELVDAALNQTITCPPVQSYPLSNFQNALESSNNKQSNSFIRSKLVFDCRE